MHSLPLLGVFGAAGDAHVVHVSRPWQHVPLSHEYTYVPSSPQHVLPESMHAPEQQLPDEQSLLYVHSLPLLGGEGESPPHDVHESSPLQHVPL